MACTPSVGVDQSPTPLDEKCIIMSLCFVLNYFSLTICKWKHISIYCLNWKYTMSRMGLPGLLDTARLVNYQSPAFPVCTMKAPIPYDLRFRWGGKLLHTLNFLSLYKSRLATSTWSLFTQWRGVVQNYNWILMTVQIAQWLKSQQTHCLSTCILKELVNKVHLQVIKDMLRIQT